MNTLLMNTFQYTYQRLLDFTWPVFDMFNQYRPLILLPFNIWFFFASLPFRIFFFFMNAFRSTSFQAPLVLKEKTVIIQSPVETDALPTITVSKASPQIRQRKVATMEDRPFSWYSVSETKPVVQTSILDEFASKLEEIKQKKEEVMPKEEKVDESSELKSRIAELEQREKAATEEKQRLESELEQLTSKYNDDEKVLATFEQDRARFKESIAVEQKRRFDFQQDIIALKNQLRVEQESRAKVQDELNSLKMSQEAAKPKESTKAKKNKSKKTAAKTETSAQTDVVATPKSLESEAPKSMESEAPKSVWNVPHHEHDYTEMVAAAQKEESGHKKGSDVVKESLMEPAAEVPAVEEFVVVGGDLSSKHITMEPETAPVTEEAKPETAAPAETETDITKSVWNVPHHEHDYTEMVVAAQKEEAGHKKGSDVVKESLMEPAVAPAADEFTVVGGDLSTKHITLNNNEPTIASTN